MGLAGASQAALAEVADAPLLERDKEVARIAAAFEGARAGTGSVIILDGAPGNGKSRLLETCRGIAEAEGMAVLAATAREPEQGFDFGVAVQLFENRLAGAAPEEHELLLAGAARRAAPLLAPGPRDSLPRGDEFSLLHGLYRLCANLAEQRPLVMLVDDADWADDLSLQFLLYLGQRVAELPVAVVLACDGAGRDGPEALHALTEQAGAPVLRVEPLGEDAVASWLRETVFPEAHNRFCRACHEATGGNPLLLRELALELSAQGVRPNRSAVRAVSERAPDRIASAVLIRLRRLGPGALELARAVTVAGDDSELRHCAALAGLDQADAARLADRLADTHILRGSKRLAFRHPVVGRALYARLPTAERASAHQRLAELLVAEKAPDEVVAIHLLEASSSGHRWVVDALTAAADRALGRGDPDAAVRYLRRALEEPPSSEARARVMLELGRAEAVAGEGQAVDRLNAAIELIEDPRQRARTSLDIGRALYAQGRHGDAAEAFRLGAIEARGLDPKLQMQLHTAHTLVAKIIGLPADGVKDTAPPPQADEVEAGDTPTGRVLLAHMALEAALHGTPREEVVELARSALDRGALLRSETSDGLGCYFAAAALAIAEDLQGAEIALAMAVEDARARGSVLGFATACYFRSWTVLGRGRVADAAADAQNALAAERYGWRVGLPGAHAIMATVFQERGERAAASRELELGAKEASASGEMPLPFLVASRAAFLLGEGQPEEALAAYLECAERLEAAGANNPACIPWRSGAAQAYEQLGDRREAERLLEEELALARSFGAPGAIGRTLHTYGTFLNGNGMELLRESVDVLRESQSALERARSLVALGAALRRAGKRAESRDPLREGLDLAERCGSRALAEQARSEAVAAGTRPRRTALRGVEALTPRELQVARLAAEGMSNREIAESLFVTLKTVEWHLRHGYDKLEIGSRKELQSKLAGHGQGV